jgi:hypothetical protein
LSDAYEETDFAMDNFVPKPEEWSSYPPALGNTTLQSYTEQKSAIQGAELEDK